MLIDGFNGMLDQIQVREYHRDAKARPDLEETAF